MQIEFLITFANNGIIDNIAALVSVVNGVTISLDMVIIGASPDNTIKQKASAPPKNPIRQITITRGAIIIEIPSVVKVSEISGSMNKYTTEMAPKAIHRES
jgi:hypothetical protein